MGIARSDLFILINLCSCILIPLCNSRPSDDHNHNNNVALFVFGDSLFDPGNNNYLRNPAAQANFWPYGQTYFNHPTGRFSDGRLTSDFIAEYAKLSLIPPYLQPGSHQFTYGSNFASGRAGALSETQPGMVINLKTQLTYFKNVEKKLRKKLGYAETKKLLSTATYMLSIGGNDYIARVANFTVLQSYSKEEYVGMVIDNLTDVIKEIHKSEGRKFGFLNVPPLSRFPIARLISLDTKSELSKLEILHNKALAKTLKDLQRQLQGFRYSEFDFYTSLKERITNPSKYGFKEAKVACRGSGEYREITNCGRGEYVLCENLREYLFFDGGHLTEKTNKQISKLMWSGSSDIARPRNLKAVFEI